MDSLVVAREMLDFMSILMKKIVKELVKLDNCYNYIREQTTSMFTKYELQELIEYVCTT